MWNFATKASYLVASLRYKRENIAKGTTDPRVEFISQVAHKS